MARATSQIVSIGSFIRISIRSRCSRCIVWRQFDNLFDVLGPHLKQRSSTRTSDQLTKTFRPVTRNSRNDNMPIYLHLGELLVKWFENVPQCMDGNGRFNCFFRPYSIYFSQSIFTDSSANGLHWLTQHEDENCRFNEILLTLASLIKSSRFDKLQWDKQ